MRTVDQLKNDFVVYLDEVERCKKTKCYWALLHILLALPDVCASLEVDGSTTGFADAGDRYVGWCHRYLPNATTPGDRYQMRNALFHQGSLTADNRSKDPKKRTAFAHFSYVDPFVFDVTIHHTSETPTVLDVHPLKLAEETVAGLLAWFDDLQRSPERMERVESNLVRLVRRQPKRHRERVAEGANVITIEVHGPSTSST